MESAGKNLTEAAEIRAREDLEREIGQLRNRCDELQAIYDGMADGLLIVDIETKKFVRANAAMCSMTGYTEEELLSMSVSDIHPARDLPAILDVFAAQVEGRLRVGEALPVLRKDGRVFFADINTRVISYRGRSALAGYFHDVTQRKQAEDKSRDTRALFDNAVNLLTDVFYVFDVNGRMLFWNEAFKRVTGYSDEELPSKRPTDFFAGEDVQQIAAGIERIWRDGTSHQEASFVLKDGTHAPYEFTGSILLDGAGNTIGFSGTGRDLRERKRAEEALRASERKYRDYIDHSPTGVFVADATGRYVEVNRCACRFLGYTEDELTHRSIPDIVAPEDVGEAMAGLRQLVEVGSELTDEFCFIRKDQSRFYMSVHAVRLAPDRVIAFCVDTTDRKRAEQELLEAKRVSEAAEAETKKAHDILQAAIDGISNPIMVVDRHFQIVLANRAARNLAGGVDPVASKLTCYQVSHWQDVPCGDDAHPCPVKMALEKGASVKVVHQHHDSMGMESIVEVTAVPLFDEDGEIRSVIESCYDITALKKTEADARKAEYAAEAADRAKSEFLANMSHEIRTPMTAILGFADILAANPTPEEAAEAVQIIQDNGQILLQLINDILDLSKIEAGKYELQQVACSPRQIAADVVSMMKVRADAKGLTLALEEQGQIPEAIWTDAARFRQILVNLVGNAVKFTETGGVRMVMRMDTLADGLTRLRCDVIDTGIGMSKAQMKLLYEPFTQVDASARRRFGGTSLGLAISKRLAEMLHGHIEAASTPGQGSIFSLSMALEQAAEAGPSVETTEGIPRPAPVGGDLSALSCRILLAEDGVVNQRLVSLVLGKAGAEVVVAENGQVAVDLVLSAQQAGTPFAAVLMDMQMPVLDGYEATRLLRAAGYGKPIIALTAHAMTEDRQKCIDAGCDDYISKPIDQGLLLETVAKHTRAGQRRP